tara:strand:+ start:14389 stop:14496 length:108 start_codon:yes stop_codon:yes gene_type:complete
MNESEVIRFFLVLWPLDVSRSTPAPSVLPPNDPFV